MSKQNKKLTIGIDLDNTILSSAEIIMELYNDIYNTNYKVDYKTLDWDFQPALHSKEEINNALMLFSHKDFYNPKYVKPFEKAIETVNQLLDEGHRVAICSKQCIERRNNSLEWIKNTFNSNLEVLFADSFDKSKVMGDCDIFIDDRIDALLSVNTKHRLLYGDYNWNKGDFEQIKRVNNWQEVKQVIDNILGGDK